MPENQMNKKYRIELAGKPIGYTYFESSDAPMGVVIGKVHFEEVKSPYALFKEYCTANEIELNEDDPESEAIFTQSIDRLRVFRDDGLEIKGGGATISGFKEEGYEIDVFGIPYPFYGEEFKHHRDAYENQFK
jgi:hypothetical protein